VSRPKAIARDVLAVAKCGRRAPRWRERIWVKPLDVISFYEFSPVAWTEVVGGDWDRQVRPIEEQPIVRIALAHWRDGLTWEEAGAYNLHMRRIEQKGGGRVDGCLTMDEVVARYQRLDETFEQVRVEGRLWSRAELGEPLRETGGVVFNIARDGSPVFGAAGCHRFAMALTLRLEVMPAMVGRVHPGILGQWRTKFAAGHPSHDPLP
jgi:hypothetical protein